jgi:rare lipoprotein A
MQACHRRPVLLSYRPNLEGAMKARPGQSTITHLIILLFTLAAFLAFQACARKVSPPPSGPNGKPLKGTFKPYTVFGRSYTPLLKADGYQESGLASWYGPDFHGKRTANGERYNMEAMTAAHKILPMNTWVKVENLGNGRSEVVRINDRGPFVGDRVIDLSKAAARKLGVLGPGTARVRVTALGYREAGTGVGGAPAKYRKPVSYTQGSFGVQVGAFTNINNATRLAAKLRRDWPAVVVVRYDRGDAVFHRVRVGRVTSLPDAYQLQAKLRKQGFPGAMAVSHN